MDEKCSLFTSTKLASHHGMIKFKILLRKLVKGLVVALPNSPFLSQAVTPELIRMGSWRISDKNCIDEIDLTNRS